MKLQSAKCLWCAGNCLSWVRCLTWYCCDAVDCGGSSWCSVCCGLFMILRKCWSSHFSSSSPNCGSRRWRLKILSGSVFQILASAAREAQEPIVGMQIEWPYNNELGRGNHATCKINHLFLDIIDHNLCAAYNIQYFCTKLAVYEVGWFNNIC